jgi:cation diffusion facilitator CzcD-associated flavoprotein CzcO
VGSRGPRLAIIGAGPGGLCMGKRLLDEGYGDFVLLERADDVGGTWNRNRYPGCECDVPSALYSFSFEFKTDWSKPYGTQPEILAYMQGIADTYGLRPHCRLGDGVASARWNETTASWTLTLDSGDTVEAEVVVSAIGMFNDLHWPDIEGLDSFGGALWHSAQWDWNHDLRGDRVAVIGSAASAVQFVPEIVKVASQVHLFQRTPNWVLPKIDDPYTPEQLAAFRSDPAPLLAFRAEVERNMNLGMTFSDPKMLAEREAVGLAAIDVVRDPDVRAKLRPTHPFGCKRPLFSNLYYPAFNEPNLELVTEPIARVTPLGVVTGDGTERAVDAIVVATGFAATKYLSAIDVTGRNGRRIDDAWNDGPLAYLGITTSGFPNLFMLYGPNTNNGSILTMIEAQVDHILAHLRRLANESITWIDVKPQAMQRYNDDVQDAIDGVRVWQAGCHGYYRSPSGRIVTQWPYSMSEYQHRTATLDPDAFEVGTRSHS